MRIDLKNDAQAALSYTVYLDGEVVEYAVEADTDCGWVDVFDGRITLEFRQSVRRYYGRVELLHVATGKIIR